MKKNDNTFPGGRVRSLSLRIMIGLLFLTISAALVGQKKVKFGNVPTIDLQMKTYEKDTSAVAVVLYDKGHFKVGDFNFYRHVRIKILKNAGTSYGNFTLNVPTKGSFKAFVFNLEKGEVLKEKLERASVEEEETTQGDYVYKLFLPNVKVGSVIDLQYSHFAIPYEWRFQDLIPTMHSELIMEESSYIAFSKLQKGFEQIQQIRKNHWVAKDMPAFYPEPYVSHYSNYVSKFEFQVTSVFHPNGYHKEYSTTWEIVGKRLLESDYFGGVIRAGGFLNEKAAELRAADLTVEEKVQAAYNYVKENIKWNGRHGIYASPALRENFKKHHSGSIPEINLTLLALLKKIEIKAYPLILSTRANGLLSPFSPSQWRLNYVAAYVDHDGYTTLLDASQPLLTPGILPAKCLNGQGRIIIDKNQGKWIGLQPQKPSSKRRMIQIKLDEYGEHTASITQSQSQYHYLDWVNEFNKQGSETNYARFLEESLGDIYIDEYTVSKNDGEKLSSAETMQVDVSDFVDDLGNEVILNPYFMSELKENPFRSPRRKYPVDLNFLRKTNAFISIELPETFIPSSLPQSVSIKTPDGGISFTYLCNQQGNKISIQYKLDLKKTVFTESEYGALREFYSAVITKLSESIQIAKRT